MRSLNLRLETLESGFGRLTGGKLLNLFLAALSGDAAAEAKLLNAPMTGRSDRMAEVLLGILNAPQGSEVDDESE